MYIYEYIYYNILFYNFNGAVPEPKNVLAMLRYPLRKIIKSNKTLKS